MYAEGESDGCCCLVSSESSTTGIGSAASLLEVLTCGEKIGGWFGGSVVCADAAGAGSVMVVVEGTGRDVGSDAAAEATNGFDAPESLSRSMGGRMVVAFDAFVFDDLAAVVVKETSWCT